MQSIRATRHLEATPGWALLERNLLDLMTKSVAVFLERYTAPDGRLIWGDLLPDHANGTNSADDFYEPFYNWPLLYVLGGGDELLSISKRQWHAVTEQLESLGVLSRGFLRYGDQLHLSEAYNFFRFLCLADPEDAVLRDAAIGIARMYLGDDPEAPNFDRAVGHMRAPVTGSDGPRFALFGGEHPSYPWRGGQSARYGLPFTDVPGVGSYEDLRDPGLARDMGETMAQRMAFGDVPINLFVTSLVSNAYLLTQEDTYREWVLGFASKWARLADANGGIVPDNVGPSGMVGELISGKWYGGHYGWTWPLGFYVVQPALQVGGCNAALLSRDASYLQLPRAQLDAVMERGQLLRFADSEMSLPAFWTHEERSLSTDTRTFMIPYRHDDSGWFDYQPPQVALVASLWASSHQAADWDRLIDLRSKCGYDWTPVYPFFTKSGGHEQPWIEYLDDRNPNYPEAILSLTHAAVCEQIRSIRGDTGDMRSVEASNIDDAVHQWQYVNPVLTEALVQLTMGGPQPIYYGGPLVTPLRHFDAERRRPGLPRDVAALVEQVDSEGVTVLLVNLSAFEERHDVIQAGGLREHSIRSASHDVAVEALPPAHYPGPTLTDRLQTTLDQPVILQVEAPYLQVDLPPATQVRIRLEIDWGASEPTYAFPWQAGDQHTPDTRRARLSNTEVVRRDD